MNIVYIANEKFAVHLGVSLYSLYERNRYEKDIRVFIISTGIGEDSLGKLKSIAKRFGRDVEIIELKDTSKYFDIGLQDSTFDISKMGRLLVGEILPEDVNRILYLDCDMVILHSIRELYNTELGENIIAAVEEPTVLERVRYEIGLDFEASYVNAGLLLIDLKKWRENNLGEKTISYSKSIWDKSLFGEQDAINGVLRWKIKKLLPKYNFFSNYKYFSYNSFIKVYGASLSYTKKDLKEAKRRPVIIHFAGDERPWIAGSFNPYKKAYDYFKKKTPFRDVPIEKGKNLYMLIYHMMDLVTCICPILRKRISEYYIDKAYKKHSERK